MFYHIQFLTTHSGSLVFSGADAALELPSGNVAFEIGGESTLCISCIKQYLKLLVKAAMGIDKLYTVALGLTNLDEAKMCR